MPLSWLLAKLESEKETIHSVSLSKLCCVSIQSIMLIDSGNIEFANLIIDRSNLSTVILVSYATATQRTGRVCASKISHVSLRGII